MAKVHDICDNPDQEREDHDEKVKDVPFVFEKSTLVGEEFQDNLYHEQA
jgi:hypothetical protein